MFLYVIKDEDLKRTILGTTLEWVVLVRSDKRTQKYPKPTVADPSIRVYNGNNYSYYLPLLAIHDSQSNQVTDNRLTSNG